MNETLRSKTRQLKFILLGTAFLASCATTTFRAVQRAPDFDVRFFHRWMVVALFHNTDIRQRVEQEFVKQAKQRGIYAVASYEIIPSSITLTKETVTPYLTKGGYDAVLVLRVIDRKSVAPGEVQYSSAAVAAENRNTDSSQNWRDAYLGPTVSAKPHQLVAVDATLYEITTERVLWDGVTETRIFDTNSATKQIPSYTKLVLDKLYQ